MDEMKKVKTDAIEIAEILKRIKSGGGIVVNNYSPEALDEKTAAREFKKAQRDLSLEVS